MKWAFREHSWDHHCTPFSVIYFNQRKYEVIKDIYILFSLFITFVPFTRDVWIIDSTFSFDVGGHNMHSDKDLLSSIHVCINTLRPRQNGRHFPDDIYKCIFLIENVRISNTIWLKFLPKGQLTLIQIWFRLWFGAGQATSHYLKQWWPC